MEIVGSNTPEMKQRREITCELLFIEIVAVACLDYNVQKNELCISGMDSTGLPRVWKLALPDLYNYANDGAWLPRLESDGVPAYIKARSTE